MLVHHLILFFPSRPRLFFGNIRQVISRGQDEMCQAGKDTFDGIMLNGSTICKACEGSFKSIWVTNNVCFECVRHRRTVEKICPYTPEKCCKELFCPHHNVCLQCDPHLSCLQCGMLKGDGEDVLALIEHIKPVHIFCDFDSTLASTKNGQNPMKNSNHSIDADLSSALASNHSCILTRNSHALGIRTFLESNFRCNKTIESHTSFRECIDAVKDGRCLVRTNNTLNVFHVAKSGSGGKADVILEALRSFERRGMIPSAADVASAQKEPGAYVTGTLSSTCTRSTMSITESQDEAKRQEKSHVIFIDDSMREMMSPKLVADKRVIRFLFTRA